MRNISLLLSLTILCFACKSDSLEETIDTKVQEEETENKYDKIGIFLTEQTNYPLLILHENGQRILTIDENNNKKMDGYILWLNEHTEIYTQIDEKTLLPLKTTFSGGAQTYIYSFNEEKTLMSIAIIDSDDNKEIEYKRDIPFDYSSFSSLTTKVNTNKNENISEIEKTISELSLNLKLIGCGVSLGTGNAFVATLTCGALIVDTIQILNKDSDKENILLDFVDNRLDYFNRFNDSLGCSLLKIDSCLGLVVDLSELLIEPIKEFLNEKERLKLAENILKAPGIEKYLNTTWFFSWNNRGLRDGSFCSELFYTYQKRRQSTNIDIDGFGFVRPANMATHMKYFVSYDKYIVSLSETSMFINIIARFNKNNNDYTREAFIVITFAENGGLDKVHAYSYNDLTVSCLEQPGLASSK